MHRRSPGQSDVCVPAESSLHLAKKGHWSLLDFFELARLDLLGKKSLFRSYNQLLNNCRLLTSRTAGMKLESAVTTVLKSPGCPLKTFLLGAGLSRMSLLAALCTRRGNMRVFSKIRTCGNFCAATEVILRSGEIPEQAVTCPC